MHAKASNERFADPMEHRWGQRFALEVSVSLAVGGLTVGSGILRDASVSGALIDTALDIPAYTNLVVSLGCATESVPAAFALEACVTRRTPRGFAVEWRDMACPSIIALLERITGRRANALVQDQAFEHGR
jgi:hypothetical protein